MAGLTYVALGDSYAAGVGGGIRRNVCWRADDGYPVQLARRFGLTLAYNACLGATIGDVMAHQLAELGPDTRLVTITVGGNDIGFVPVLIAAAQPGWMSNSDTAIDKAIIALRGTLPGRLAELFGAVTAAAPDARVVVTGYPRLFNGVDCNLATFFSEHEMKRLNEAADELASVIALNARKAGFGYVGLGTRFTGHAVCDTPEWINGASFPLEHSFHPNALGHTAYADAVADSLADSSWVEREPGAQPEPAEVVQGPCIPGSAPTFALPDLLSEASLSGARSFGLDPEEVRSLATTLYQGTDRAGADQTGMRSAEPSAESLAARDRLRELDAQVRAERGELHMF